MSEKRASLGVFLSGSGTTLQNLIDRRDRGELPVDFAFVLSSRKGAYGLERAEKAGIPTELVSRKDAPDWEAFNRGCGDVIAKYEPDLIVFAGFMSLFQAPAAYRHRVMNVHPALIPSFCGKGYYGHHVHEAVLEHGVRYTGATVHFVDDEYDTGPIVLQRPVEVLYEDTPDTLAERVQAAEREIYPEAIALFATGRLAVEGRRVKILSEEDAQGRR